EPYPRVVPVLCVAPLASDVQTLSIGGAPTGGNFTLSFGGQTTTAILFNASAAQVQAALQALSTIGTGNVATSGGPLAGASVTITFVGKLAFAAEPAITVGANNLTGGTTPTPAIVHTTTGSLVNDVQTLTVTGVPTGGSFSLTFAGQTTAAIPFGANAGQVQAALQGLAAVGAGNVVCAGGPLPGAGVTITFVGNLGFAPQPTLTIGVNNLTGGTNPAPAIAHTTSGQGVSNVVLPVDAGNAVIPNLGWDATRSRLVDATTQAPLTV